LAGREEGAGRGQSGDEEGEGNGSHCYKIEVMQG
jgi:hypothetical protein